MVSSWFRGNSVDSGTTATGAAASGNESNSMALNDDKLSSFSGALGKAKNIISQITTANGSQNSSIKDAVSVLYPPVAVRHVVAGSSVRANNSSAGRFSPLQLEHGEKHLQDWAVQAYSVPVSTKQKNSRKQKSKSKNEIDLDKYPTMNMNKIAGRLHLCSRSVVFEPADASRAGTIRCTFAKMNSPPEQNPIVTSGDVVFVASAHAVHKANGQAGPVLPVPSTAKFRFSFLHSSPAVFVSLCKQLFDILAAAKKGSFSAAGKEHPALQALLKPMLDRPFCMDNLVDIRETVLLTVHNAENVTPLLSCSGLVVMTERSLYFQPCTGITLGSESAPADSWLLSTVQATARRYNGLRDSALEIYFYNSGHQRGGARLSSSSSNQTSLLLAFERRHDREQVMRFLPSNIPCFTDRSTVEQVADLWRANELSNYEYLLALNSAAGRSFHDLSRYPVFPWVIQDYSSDKLDLQNPDTYRDLTKPVGALNEERLEYFLTRLHHMQDAEQHQMMSENGIDENSSGGSTTTNHHQENFLYGTHYSAPGYVLYYLVRSMPEHMLCLQNGKFDAADRMFHSIQSCYACCMTNHADVKELIPEFFSDRSSVYADFLLNARGLQLGATQTGDRVDDVQLPPWARSARDFVRKNRAALESEYCSDKLPAWIDLIFGVHSRGKAALDANNLFHPCAYLGSTDLSAMATEQERYQAELQATEFGIVPDLLFCKPHPKRSSGSVSMEEDTVSATDFVSPDIGRDSSKEDATTGGREAWELLDHPPTEQSISDPDPTQTSSNDNDEAKDNKNMTADDTISDRNPFNLGHEHQNGFATNPQQNSSIDSTTKISNLPLRGTGETAPGGGDFSTLYATQSQDDADLKRQHQQKERQRLQTPTSSATSPDIPINKGSDVVSEWDMKVMQRQQIHDDTVSACVLVLEDNNSGARKDETAASSMPSSHNKEPKSILVTSSLDGGLVVNTISLECDPNFSSAAADDQERRGFSSTLTRFSYSTIMSRGPVASSGKNSNGGQQSSRGFLSQYRTHSSRDPLASLVLASDGNSGHVAFTGGHDDIVLAYGINSACAVASIYSHRDAVTGLDILARTPFEATDSAGLWLSNSTHIMVSGSWDATVKVWSLSVSPMEAVNIRREPLAELFDADASIACVAAVKVVGQEHCICIAAGCADGSFCVWAVHTDGVQVVLHKEPPKRGAGPCSVVKWIHSSTDDKLHLLAAFSTGSLTSYALTFSATGHPTSTSTSLRRQSGVSVGVPVSSLAYLAEDNCLLVGCADGGLRLVQLCHGSAIFDTSIKPTLWNAVNNKSAPGISSISVTYLLADAAVDGNNTNNASNCERFRRICCTGAEDGSIALFELKRVNQKRK